MAVTIFSVLPGSPGARAGIQAGDVLSSINGHEISDVLDYQFYMTESRLELHLADGRKLLVKKREYDDLGFEFETYLMDRQHSCKNKCIFCFVDQTPKGMRPSLYFKDDDDRLSFLFGNYITLTNLEQREIDRIIEMKISPVNISVHTTNPALRVRMMANPRAGESLQYLKQLADAGIKMNTQLVLCPGINDGAELERSLRDLAAFYPSVESIACVPVGLTDHREGLAELEPYTPQTAGAVIGIIHQFAGDFETEHGTRLAYPADEFFLKAGMEIPGEAYYGDFDQLDNGVGLIASLKGEFHRALKDAQPVETSREVSVATGEAAYPLMRALSGLAMERFPGLRIHVHQIINDFFGKEITVAGLVTGRDLLGQLTGKPLGERLLIPSVMLRHEQDRFLDDVTLEEAQEALGVEIALAANDGYELLEKLLGGQTSSIQTEEM